MSKILDGKAYSAEIIEKLKVKYLSNPTDKRFAIVSVGDDYGSKVYCAMKKKRSEYIGIGCDVFHYDNISQMNLEKVIKKLACLAKYAGIMIQHPLSKEFDERKLLDLIPPEKDVDGLSYQSLGKLQVNNPLFMPATAVGIVELLKHNNINLVGKKVLVVGRSQIVGLPLANMLIRENSTVTVAHSKTIGLDKMIADFDIVIVAIGKKAFVKADWFKEGQIMVDAGYNEGNVGDIDPEAYKKASYYTPVPGGVGPMTIASLMVQLDKAIELSKSYKAEKDYE